MEYRFAILLLLLLNACVDAEGGKSRKLRETAEFQQESVTGKREEINSLMKDVCSAPAIEYTDWYPVLDSIPGDKHEKLILVDSLRNMGFTMARWGRGNWPEGPRIVSFTLRRESCECQVDKLYYATLEKGRYKVTERIRCRKSTDDGNF